MFIKTHTGKKLAKDPNKRYAKILTGKLTNDLLKNKTEAKGGKSKDRTEEDENKDHTRVFMKTHTRKKLAKDLDKRYAKIPTRKLTNNGLKNKTEAKGGKSKDRTEDGKNKDHTRVFGKTHTGKITKDLAEDDENKDHTRVFVKTHTGKIAKDLTKVLTKTHTGKLAKDLAKRLT